MTHPQLDHEESMSRLDAVMRGPWAQAADRGMSILTVNGGAKGPREGELARLLRPHWKGDGISGQDIDDRDDVDQALTRLQLLESAIEMGYLPESVVRDEARGQLGEALWSRAARQFVRDYDYLSIHYLATRLGLDIGQTKREAPSVKPQSAVRFSAVLAEHGRWYLDDGVQAFIKLMDDIRYYDGEQEALSEYLRSGHDARIVGDDAWMRERMTTLAHGAEQFVVRVSNVMDLLNDDERARVGLVYAYWLAKFFGWDLTDNGFVREDDGWSDDVAASVMPLGVKGDGATFHVESFADRIKVLGDAWNAVLSLEKSLRG